MDSNGNDFKSDCSDVKNNTLSDVDSKTSLLEVEEDEMVSLLPSRKVEKPQRKVMWNDSCGNELAEVLEYQPR